MYLAWLHAVRTVATLICGSSSVRNVQANMNGTNIESGLRNVKVTAPGLDVTPVMS